MYLFIFGPVFCYWLFFRAAADADGNTVSRVDDAKDLFLAILPISSGILAYWFAARGAEKMKGE